MTTVRSAPSPFVPGRGAKRLAGSSALLGLGCAVVVGTALVFEHGFGFMPCALCLQERVPYYVAVAIGAAGFAVGSAQAPAGVVRVLLALVGIAMLWSLSLAVFHAGVEYKWWPGPADCAARAGANLTDDLLSTIDAVRPPACDRPAGTFLGLSFAGWNAVASAALALAAFAAAAAPVRVRR